MEVSNMKLDESASTGPNPMHADGTDHQTLGRTGVLKVLFDEYANAPGKTYSLCPLHSFACHGMGKKFLTSKTNG